MKKFYSHLIEIESLFIELDNLNLSAHEKQHLAKLVDSNLHHSILDAILDELSEEDKKKFLAHLSEDNHDKIWQLLKEKIENIEGKIKKAADSLKVEMHKDLKDSKKITGD